MDPIARPTDPESLLADDAFVRRLARQLVRDEASAHDLAQATWLQWVKRPASGTVPRAWLATVARRLAGRAHRTKLRRDARERMARAPEPAPSPEQVLAREELRATVVAAVLRLTPLLRDVVVLRFFEGLPPRAIAERLAVPVETVRTRQKRALQELKQRLDASTDGGRAAWCTALMPLLSARAESVWVASQQVGGVVAKVVAGWAAAAMLMVGASVWAVAEIAREREDVVSSSHVVANETGASTMPSASDGSDAAASEVRRVEAPAIADSAIPSTEPAEQVGASSASTARVAAWPVQFLCVGADGLAIAGAEIRLYEGQLFEGPRFPGGSVRRAETANEPFATLVSGEDGRTEGMVPFELCVAAAVDPRAPERRTSEFCIVRRSGGDYHVVLEEPIALTGRAFDAAGNPLVGAEVKAMPRPLEFGMRLGAWIPDAVVASEDGSFSIPALPFLTYELTARSGDLKTSTVTVLPDRQPLAPIELRVSSRATVHGVVLDDVGRGVSGARVHVVRDSTRSGETSIGRDASVGEFATTAGDGSFSLEMPRYGPFRIVAGASGFASSNVHGLTTDFANPVAHATLVLQAYSRIEGRIVSERGAPLVGALATFVPEAMPESTFGGIKMDERFGGPGPTPTDESGRFAVRVHPGARWTIRVVQSGGDPELFLEVRGIEPGRTDVEVRVPEQAMHGCVLRGRVVRPDGAPLPAFAVNVMHHVTDYQQRGIQARVTVDGDRFWTEPLPFGGRFTAHLLYELPPTGQGSRVYRQSYTAEFAPFRTAVLTLDAATVDCELQVRSWGSVRARVVDATGRPMPGVKVQASDGDMSYRPEAITDPEGFALLACTPGPNELVVWRERQRAATAEVEVVAGERVEAELRYAMPSGR